MTKEERRFACYGLAHRIQQRNSAIKGTTAELADQIEKWIQDNPIRLQAFELALDLTHARAYLVDIKGKAEEILEYVAGTVKRAPVAAPPKKKKATKKKATAKKD